MIENNKLSVFENFVVDQNLRSHKSSVITDLDSSGSSFNINGSISRSFNRTEDVQVIDYLHYVHQHEKSFKSWARLNLATIFFKKKTIKKVKYESVDVFFRNIKQAVKILDIEESSITFYANAIDDALNNGQEALKEILRSKKEGILAELNLLKADVTKYVSEEDVIEFYHRSKLPEKILKLTWVKNYIRVIPEDVMRIKREFDSKEVFDNYVILHFDKNDSSTEMTEKEKEKAKDPILFGVVKGSRKLYYVADWIDEYCDLTLEKMLETLEIESPKELTKEVIENNIKS